MVSLQSDVTGSDLPIAFFGPVTILPRAFVEESLLQSLLLPLTDESSPSGPDLLACLESLRVGPGLILCLDEPAWLALALLNQESHEHVAYLLSLPD